MFSESRHQSRKLTEPTLAHPVPRGIAAGDSSLHVQHPHIVVRLALLLLPGLLFLISKLKEKWHCLNT